MALDSYTNLQAAVATWLHRDDLTAVIPDFITLAEDAIGRDLADLPVMWAASATTTLASGQNTLALPSDALGIVYAKLLAPWHVPVDVVPLAALVRDTGLNSTTTGKPQSVAFRGNAGAAGTPSVLVWPKADQSYDFEFGYRATVPALSAGNPVNFVLKRAPSIYLYGTLIASAPFIGQDARMALWEAKYRQAIESFKSQDWDGPMLLGTELARGAAFDIATG